jgi:stage II sporulation protein D
MRRCIWMNDCTYANRNRYIKRFLSLLISLVTVLTVVSFPSAEYSIPQYIRVGLYFTDASAHIDTSVSSISVSAAQGVSAGFLLNGAFTEIYGDSSSNPLTIKKDSSYCIKIGTVYADYASATAGLQLLQTAGIKAYIAYADAWQVWTGAFADNASANQYMTADLTAALGQGTYSVVAPASNRVAVLNQSGETLFMFASSTASFQTKPKPENNPLIQKINNKAYRGAIEVKRITGSDMTVINVVTLNEYLYGNVPSEIGGSSHAEALKAQAIAASMYAINNRGKHGKTGFDVCATTDCQVYKGYSAEVAACNTAIDQVAGKVITYNGKLASQIYYFASSAGRTEDPVNVWGYSYDYLKSVEDKYEPIYNWTKTLRASDIKTKIPSIGNILGMSITKTSETGRVTQLSVRGDKSTDPAVYNRERSRTVFSLNSQLYTITTDADVYVSNGGSDSSKVQLGGKTIKSSGTEAKISSSTNKVTVLGAGGKTSTVALVPETYTFTGKGWGHAVGMSQEGARSMAKAGITYDQILTHYFPGTKIE